MIRKICVVIKALIGIYICVIAIFYAFLLTQDKLYDNDLPTVLGYGYYKVDTTHLEPEIMNNNSILIEKTELIEKDDYVIYRDINGILRVKKVIERNGFYLNLNYLDEDEPIEIKIEDTLGKVIFNDNKFSQIFNFFTNGVVIVGLIVLLIALPSPKYNRYEYQPK